MFDRVLIYRYLDKDYKVNVTTKLFQKGTYFRYKNGEFYVTTNVTTGDKTIFDCLNKFAGKLIKGDEVRSTKAYSFEEGWLYLFGNKIEMLDGLTEDNLEKFLKKSLLDYLNASVRHYEEEMGIKTPYKIHVKKMSTRFGSNSSQTHSLSFQLDLVHFSPEIIDSVVVHELAHEFYHDHSKNFYNVIYQYCPDYWKLKRKLQRRIFA